jgi:peptidoglycan lytic transglycosylase
VSASLVTAVLFGGTYLALDSALSSELAQRITQPSRPEALSRDLERTPSPSVSPSAPAKPAAPLKVTQTGSCGASYYDEPQHTANGEIFDPEAMTAAHKTLPFNSRVRVTNPASGKSVIVRINDRGPYISGRCLDLSRAAFRAIANLSQGVLSKVTYEVLG